MKDKDKPKNVCKWQEKMWTSERMTLSSLKANFKFDSRIKKILNQKPINEMFASFHFF